MKETEIGDNNFVFPVRASLAQLLWCDSKIARVCVERHKPCHETELLTLSDDDGVKMCPCPKARTAIYSCCGAEGTSETPRDTANRPTCKDFIPEVFSFIGNAAHALLNKIITLNEKLHTRGDAISRMSENDALREAPPRDDRQSTSRDQDPPVSLQRVFSSQQAASESKGDSREASLSSRMCMGEGSCEEIRKIKHSIIEDRRNDTRYLLTSTSGCDCDLARNFGRPYKVRRSLLIRSRLRDPASSRDQPSPFCLIKRARRRTPEDDDEAKGVRTVGREESVLKDSGNFSTLPESVVTEAGGNDGNVSETREHSDEVKERISRERSHDTASSEVPEDAVQERKLTDNSAAELADELVTNVHYFRLQDKINTNVYNFITSEIDTMRKTHGERSS